MRTAIAATGLLAGVMAVFLVRCEGPRPVVGPVAVTREEAGWRVRAEVVNEGRGDGQVELTFRLRDAASGRSWQAGRRVALVPHERLEVSETISAPDASAPECTAQVEAQYPPR